MKDVELLRYLHREWRGECALADGTCVKWTSLHHIHKHPRSDIRANLVMLCGDGTSGHHGRIEAHDEVTSKRLARYLLRHRPDTIVYLYEKLGGTDAVHAWLNVQLHADLELE